MLYILFFVYRLHCKVGCLHTYNDLEDYTVEASSTSAQSMDRHGLTSDTGQAN